MATLFTVGVLDTPKDAFPKSGGLNTDLFVFLILGLIVFWTMKG